MAGAPRSRARGPGRVYAGVRVEDAMMGDGRRAATAGGHSCRAPRFIQRADATLIGLVALLAILVSATG